MALGRASCFLFIGSGWCSECPYLSSNLFVCVHWIVLHTHTYIVALPPPPPPPLSRFVCCSAASHTYLRPASSFYPSPAHFVRCHLDVVTPLRSRACLCSIHVLSVDLHSRVTIYRTYISPRRRRSRAPSAPFPSRPFDTIRPLSRPSVRVRTRLPPALRARPRPRRRRRCPSARPPRRGSPPPRAMPRASPPRARTR